MPSQSNPNQLIVEGSDDLHSVVGLMRAHVQWPDKPADPPVYIECGGSAEEILEREYIPTILKSRPVRTLGVMLDADENSVGRYQRLHQLCAVAFPEMPTQMPTGGLVTENADGKRLGIWIMPDNVSGGYLETFLRYLVPNEQQPVWQHAITAVAKAKSLGAGFRDIHSGKAHLYTWLAWQDPPGRSPGLALTHRVLDPDSTTAVTFVSWFRALYRL